MGRHMLKYHVGVPVAVFGVLLLLGVPTATAVRFGIVAGCAAMMLMMLGRGSHDHHSTGDDVAQDEEETIPVKR
jgi:hypothetical protein